MSIASRIQSIEQHLIESYEELEGLGIDTSSIDNNLENIPKLLDGYWETLPKVTGEGTSITLNDTKEAKMKLTLNGNTYQYSTSGINVYNVNNGGYLSPEVTIDSNYYVHCTYDNTSGTSWHYSNIMINKTNMLQTSTNYLIVAEIKSVSGTGRFYPFTQHNNSCIQTVHTYYEFSNLSAGQKILIPVTTKSSFTADTKYDLRTLVSYDVGSSGSITFRLSILSDTTITADTFVYQPFTNGASPNPSYPQNIEVVTGENDITICGKNLFDKNNITNGKYIKADGTTGTDVTAFFSTYIKIEPNTNYYISGRTIWNSIALYDSNKTFLERINLNYTSGIINITNNNSAYIMVNASIDNLNTMQLEEGSTATTYEQYQGNTYPINLGNIELCKIDTYKDRIYKKNDKWYLEKQIGKVAITANDTITHYSIWHWIGFNKPNNSIMLNNFNNYTLYMEKAYRADDRTKIYSYNTSVGSSQMGVMCYENDDATTLKQKLDGSLMYYPLATPTTTEITSSNYPTLYSQLNALNSARSYNEQTNINQENSNESSIISASALEEI